MMAVSTSPNKGAAIFEITMGSAIANMVLWSDFPPKEELMRIIKAFYLFVIATFTLLPVFHSAIAAAPSPSVTILMYHHVSETTPRVTSVSPEIGRAHV